MYPIRLMQILSILSVDTLIGYPWHFKVNVMLHKKCCHKQCIDCPRPKVNSEFFSPFALLINWILTSLWILLNTELMIRTLNGIRLNLSLAKMQTKFTPSTNTPHKAWKWTRSSRILQTLPISMSRDRLLVSWKFDN